VYEQCRELRALHVPGTAIEAATRGDDSVVEELAHHFAQGTDHARAAILSARRTKADSLYYPRECSSWSRRSCISGERHARRLEACSGSPSPGRTICTITTAPGRPPKTLRGGRQAGQVLYEARGLREVSWSSVFWRLAGALDAAARLA